MRGVEGAAGVRGAVRVNGMNGEGAERCETVTGSLTGYNFDA